MKKITKMNAIKYIAVFMATVMLASNIGVTNYVFADELQDDNVYLANDVLKNNSGESLFADVIEDDECSLGDLIEADSSYRSLPEEYREIKSIDLSLDDTQYVEEIEESYRTPAEFLPPIRSQYPTGTCWAHSAMAMAEISMAKKGQINAAEVDLSEMELAYFAYNSVVDPLNGTKGDSNRAVYSATYPNCYQIGGNLIFAEGELASWTGAGDEKAHGTAIKDIPYARSKEKNDNILGTIKDSYAYEDVAHLTASYHADIVNDMAGVKRLIKEYGAVSTSYYSNDAYYDPHNYSFYSPYKQQTNHAITIVGWDDNFSKTKFKMGTPEGDGAWLIRNSWGSNKEYDYMSYFWMSYYEKSLANEAFCFVFDNVNNDYDNNYQYDGSVKHLTYTVQKGTKTSNVYTVKANDGGHETLGGVGIFTVNPDIDVKVEIYKNLSNIDDPESGTLMSGATVETHLSYEGYHTIKLPKGVSLNAGDTFAVVVTHLNEGDTNKFVAEMSQTSSWYKITSFGDAHQSFLKRPEDKQWLDYGSTMGNMGNICIKAFTVNGNQLHDGREIIEGGDEKKVDEEIKKEPPVNVDDEKEKKDDVVIEDEKLSIHGLQREYEYTGTPVTPEFNIAVSLNGKREYLSKGTDYTVKFSNNKNQGANASITITGKGKYKGVKTYSNAFTIKSIPAPDSGATSIKSMYAIGGIDKAGYTFTGSEIRPEIYLIDKATGAKDTVLKENVDYVVTMSNNIAAGKASVLVSGIGKYNDAIKATFKINKLNIGTNSRDVTVKASDVQMLNVKGATPELEVFVALKNTDGSVYNYNLIDGKDIKIQYVNNKAITSFGSYIISGKGNFTGKITSASALSSDSSANYKIVSPNIPADPFAANSVIMACFPNLSVGEKILSSKYELYDMAGNKLKSKIVTNNSPVSDGKTHIGVIYSYKKNGEATERILNPDNPEDKSIVAMPGDVIKVKIFGNAIYQGESEPHTISVGYEPSSIYMISKVIVRNNESYSYAGKNIDLDKKDIIVTSKENKIIPGNSFDILCTNNLNKGNAIAFIRCKEGYTGYKVVKYKIGAMDLFN